MKTVKQVITEDKEHFFTDSKPLESLVRLGLLEESKFNVVKRAMFTNTSEMTMAEKKSLVSLVESLASHIINENQGKDHLTAMDPRRPAGYPSEAKIPAVLILKRKAIRVYPDNQKIALYYSQNLDKYISIPFGPKSDELGIHMNEETKTEMKKLSFETEKELSNLRESSPRETFRSKLKDIREEKLNEFGPVGPLIAAAARTAAPAAERGLLSKGADYLKGKATSALSNARKKTRASSAGQGFNLDGVKVDTVSGARAYGFRDAGRPQSPVDSSSSMQNPWGQRVPDNSITTMRTIADRRSSMMRESTGNISKIQEMVATNSKTTTVNFGDSSILINNRIGKKILNIHEALNKANKKKFEKMLNEDVVSFKKAINFVVKAR